MWITNEPIEDDYLRGSLHYEYYVKKSYKYSEYYHLVAEPTKLLMATGKISDMYTILIRAYLTAHAVQMLTPWKIYKERYNCSVSQ